MTPLPRLKFSASVVVLVASGCIGGPPPSGDAGSVAPATHRAYYETYIQSGFNMCGLSLTVMNDIMHANACSTLSYAVDTHLEKSYSWWAEYGLAENVTTILGETTFDASHQVFNKRLSVIWLALDKPKGSEPGDVYNAVIKGHDGLNPVRIWIPIEELTNIMFNGQKICADFDCPLGTGHYASTLNNTQAEASVIIQQPYTDFLTVFHVAHPSPNFTALPETVKP